MTTATTLPRKGRPPTIEVIAEGKYAMTIRRQQVRFDRTARSFRCRTTGVAPADIEYGIALLTRRFN